MSKLSFTKDNKIENFTFIIGRKDFYKYGVVKGVGVNYKSNFNGPDEISLRVYKNQDLADNLWDRINDYNVLIVPELGDDGFFEMDVDLSEDSDGLYKNITGTSLAEAELSHTKIYNYEVNTEAERTNDKEWNADYLTILYRDLSQYENDPEQYKRMKHVSLLHRLLDKLPNYTIAHVDATLLSLTDWYQFSWDDTDVYSILTGDVAEQYHVYFKFNSRYRTISVYDLYSVCNNNNCNYRAKMLADREITTRYRADFRDTCPYCGSTDVTNGYGKFTKILVSKDNLSTSASLASNKDSLINSFKVKSGDDLMDAAVANQNPNGSNYIYQFSEENKAEMPPELVTALEAYNAEYDKYYNGDSASGKGIYTFTANQVSNYNALIDRITGHFTEKTLKEFIKLKSTYTGYQSLAAQYYSVLDLLAFFETSMTPDVVTNKDSLEDTKALLETDGALSPIAIMDPTIGQRSVNIVENAVIQSANCIINTALYDLTAQTTSWTPASSSSGSGTWKGTIKIETIEYKNTEEATENTTTTKSLTLTINGDVTTYVKQKVEKLIARKDAQIKPLTDLTEFATTSDSDEAKAAYKEQLHYYSLNILEKIVEPAFQDVLSIVQDASNKINSLYYDIYYDRTKFIQDEIAVRKAEVDILKSIKAVFDGYRTDTMNKLNFANFLGTDLYNMFCNYRREDTYNNQNYISDALTNNQIMRRAGDLLDTAQKELYKASNLQFEVSGSLNNLLALPEFALIRDEFEVGNWIHMSVADKIYNLRLLSYQINFSELQTIDVEFSTVEKIWSGASDIQSVLKSAGSVAGSYSNTQSQVKQYATPVAQVKGWVDKGLEATKTKFVDDSTTQEIVYDSSGFYARGFDEITSTYLPQQLKINKNGLYTTEDNWETMSAGIGAISYYDPDEEKYIDSYGVIAKTVVGKLFLGEKLKIYSGDGTSVAKMTMDQNGLSVTNGTATVKIDPNNTNIFQILNGSTKTLYADTSGNVTVTGTVNANAGKIGGTNGWTITTNKIYNGTLGSNDSMYLGTTNLGTAKIADNSRSDWRFIVGSNLGITNTGTLYAKGANINGAITATSLDLTTNNVKIAATSVSGLSTVATTGKATDLTGLATVATTGQLTDLSGSGNILYRGDIAISESTSDNVTTTTFTYYDTSGTKVTRTTKTNSAGKYVLLDVPKGTLPADGTTSSDSSITGIVISTAGLLKASNALIYGTVYAHDGVFTGTIYANAGRIGGDSGWTIASQKLSSGTLGSNSSMYLGTANLGSAKIANNTRSDWRFTVGSSFGVTNTGALYATGANITGAITATSLDLTTNSVKIPYTSVSNTPDLTIYISKGGKVGSTPASGATGFIVSNTGLLQASNAVIWGELYSSKGTIGGWSLSSSGLTQGDYVRLKKSEIYLSSNTDSMSDSIYIKTGAKYNTIGFYGTKNNNKVNQLYVGWLNNTIDMAEEGGVDGTSYYGWGMHCTTDLVLSSDSSLRFATHYGDDIETAVLVLSPRSDGPSHFRPNENASQSFYGINLGHADYRWNTVYARNSTISTSDGKEKDILGDIPYAKNLIMSLQPKTYMWKNGDHRRTRMGFIAQEVAASCKAMGENLALFTASYRTNQQLGEDDPNMDKDYFGENIDDNKLVWGLSYHELIAPMVAVIQQQQQEIDTLKQEIENLKG